jgi:hypothetical protein
MPEVDILNCRMSEHPGRDRAGDGARERPVFSGLIRPRTAWPPRARRPGRLRWCAHRVPADARDWVRAGCDAGPGTWRSPGASRGGAPATGGRKDAIPGRPAHPTPGVPGRGHGTGAAVTCAFTAMARLPPPRHWRAAARDRPRPGRDLAGMAIRARPVRRRLMSDHAVTGAGLSGARFSRL